jgi:hypothetical protein
MQASLHIRIAVRSYKRHAGVVCFTLLPCKAGALPAELIPRIRSLLSVRLCKGFHVAYFKYVSARLCAIWLKVVGVPGLEPGTSPLSGVHSNQLSYTPLDSVNGEQSTENGCQRARLLFTVHCLPKMSKNVEIFDNQTRDKRHLRVLRERNESLSFSLERR